MKSATKIIVIVGIAVAAIIGIVLVAVRYMDVIQRQFEVFRELINRRRGMVVDDGAIDFDDDHFEDFETPDESIPDLSF